MSKKFGERIRELQEKKGVDDEYTADYLGMPVQKFRKTMSGEKPFFYDDLRLLEQFFNIRMGKLVDEYMKVPTTEETQEPEEPIEEIEPDYTESIDTILDEEEQELPDEKDEPEQEEVGEQTREPEIKEVRKKRVRRKKTEVRNENLEKSTQHQEETITMTSIQIPEYDPTSEEEVKTMIGTILKQCREIRGLRIQDISERISTSKSTWSAYENGINIPTPETIKEIIKILNADKEIFRQIYKDMTEIQEKIRKEKDNTTQERKETTMYETIEAFLENKGDIEQTAKRFYLDRSMIQKRLSKIFEQEPELEYIIYDSLPEEARIKRSGTFENANKRRLFEMIQQQYHPNMTGDQKIALAQSTGYKSWFSLQRAIEGRKTTIEQILKEKIPEKPFKEYSCKWPREEMN